MDEAPAQSQKANHGLFTHLYMDGWTEGVRRRSRVSAWVVVCRNANARRLSRLSLSLPASHARARHVDDEGTYVRARGRISYVCVTTRENQISCLRTQRERRRTHAFIPFPSPLDERSEGDATCERRRGE